MTIAERLREERQRLGMSQSALADVVEASKSAVISWEKGTSAPTAPALSRFAEAGADVLYILTGRRTFDLPIDVVPYIEAQVARVRREVLDQTYQRLPGEDADQAEKRWLEWHANRLSNILRAGFQLTPSDLMEEVAHLLDVVTNPAVRALYRAGEYTSQRAKRRELKKQLLTWLEDGSYTPGAAVTHLLVELAVDFDIPIKRLVELLHEMHEEALYRAEEEPDAGPTPAKA